MDGPECAAAAMVIAGDPSTPLDRADRGEPFLLSARVWVVLEKIASGHPDGTRIRPQVVAGGGQPVGGQLNIVID